MKKMKFLGQVFEKLEPDRQTDTLTDAIERITTPQWAVFVTISAECDRYAVMMKCWNQSVSKRPTFSELKQQLMVMFERQAIDRIYFDQMIENTFDIISSQPGEKC